MAPNSPVIVDPGVDANTLQSGMRTLIATMQMNTPPVTLPTIPGVTLVTKGGETFDVSKFGYSPVVMLQVGAALLDRARAVLAERVVDRAAERIAVAAFKASTTYNLMTDLCAPGASVSQTLTIDNSVGAVMLLGMATTRRHGEQFTLGTLNIGVSKLVAENQVLNPAAPLAGLVTAIYASSNHDDVHPLYGVGYRSETGQSIMVSVTANHHQTFGDLAYPSRYAMSLLCLAAVVPKGCENSDAIRLLASLNSNACAL